MQEKHVRIMAWIGSSILFIPILIGLLHLYSAALSLAETVTHQKLPPHWNSLLQFLIFGFSYVALAYLVTHQLNRRYPDSPKEIIQTPYG